VDPMTQSWDADFALRAPEFAPLRTVAGRLQSEHWPDCARLNALAAEAAVPPRNAAGTPIRFVPQAARRPTFEDQYEPRIFLRGEVQMRAQNWHDLFNALVWLTFPCAKAALNRRHYQALCAQRAAGAANRGPQQDALTLFDEGGVIVAAAAPDLADLLRQHEWKALFWGRRAELAGGMAFHVFGHALYEKALRPYAGVTGRGLIIECDAGFFGQSAAVQLQLLDVRVAGLLATDGRFSSVRELVAVPILGIPDWCGDNARESYYDNTDYFRPAPVRTAGRR
jgi:hypothetical protein